MSLIHENSKKFLKFKRKSNSLSSLYNKATDEIISDNISLFMDDSLSKVNENELILLHSFLDLLLKQHDFKKPNSYNVELSLNENLVYVDNFIKKYST